MAGGCTSQDSTSQDRRARASSGSERNPNGISPLATAERRQAEREQVTYAFFNPADQAGSGGDPEMQPVSSAPSLDYASVALCAAPSAEPLRALAEYWRSKCSGGALPSRSAIEPAEIVRHLPWIFMADVLDGGADYRYRLLGTGIVSANYRDVTGRSFRELYGADPAKLAGARLGFDQALVSAAPAFTTGRAFWRPDWAFDHFESAFFPLAADGAAIDIIFGEITYLTPV